MPGFLIQTHGGFVSFDLAEYLTRLVLGKMAIKRSAVATRPHLIRIVGETDEVQIHTHRWRRGKKTDEVKIKRQVIYDNSRYPGPKLRAIARRQLARARMSE